MKHALVRLCVVSVVPAMIVLTTFITVLADMVLSSADIEECVDAVALMMLVALAYIYQ